MGASAQRGTTNDARRAKIHPMDVLPREPRLMRITTSLRKPFDVVLALATTFAALGGMAAWHHGAGEHAHDAPAIAFVVVGAGTLSLVVRRRYPRAVFAAVLVAAFVSCLVVDGPRGTNVALFIGLASVAVRRPMRETLLAATAAFGVVVRGSAIGRHHLTWPLHGSPLLSVAALTAIALLIASRRAYFDQLRARARDLERERELLAE